MLRSPGHVVIGAQDPEGMARYLQGFGFEVMAAAPLPRAAARALYGIDAELREVVLRAPGTTAGWLRVVSTTLSPRAGGPFDHGPGLLDLYTRDIRKSLVIARYGGAEPGEVVTYDVSGLGNVYEAMAIGPEGLELGFVSSEERRPSVLDRDPERLHSEAHAFVWVVASVDATAPFWRDRSGLTQLLDSRVDDPGISIFMGLPRPNVPIRITHFTDSEITPIRFELLEFPDDPGQDHPTLPLAPGLHAPAFVVDDLDAAMRTLTGAEWGEVTAVETDTHGRARAVSGAAPGGVRFELWEESVPG